LRVLFTALLAAGLTSTIGRTVRISLLGRAHLRGKLLLAGDFLTRLLDGVAQLANSFLSWLVTLSQSVGGGLTRFTQALRAVCHLTRRLLQVIGQALARRRRELIRRS